MEDAKAVETPPEKGARKKLSMTTWILISLGAGIVSKIPAFEVSGGKGLTFVDILFMET